MRELVVWLVESTRSCPRDAQAHLAWNQGGSGKEAKRDRGWNSLLPRAKAPSARDLAYPAFAAGHSCYGETSRNQPRPFPRVDTSCWRRHSDTDPETQEKKDPSKLRGPPSPTRSGLRTASAESKRRSCGCCTPYLTLGCAGSSSSKEPLPSSMRSPPA